MPMHRRHRTGHAGYKRAKGKRFRPKQKLPGTVFKIQQSLDLTTSLAGQIRHSFNIYKPLAGVDNDTSFPYLDFTSLAQLYQNFDTIKIKLDYQPRLPNDTGLSTFYTPIYLAKDLDDSSSAPLTSINEAISYPGVVIKNLFRPWSHSFTITNSSFNINDNVVMMSGKPFYRVDTGTSRGVIRTYAEGLDSSTTYGVLNLSLYVNMRNRN